MNKPMLPTHKSAGYQTRKTHREFERMLNMLLAPYDLKAGNWHYLRALWQENGISQRELSDSLNVTENTTVSMVAGLEKAGLVRRERDTKDKRRINVFLSRDGRNLERKLMPLAIQINEIATAGIPSEEVEICLSVLRKARENLAAYVVE